MGLRERKKQLTRQLLSDTATEMFLERGFDEVRIAEIAEACGVSEKTVYNYFPTKESLALDQEDDMADAVRSTTFTAESSPVESMLSLLEAHMFSDAPTQQGQAADMAMIGRFRDLIESNPSLRAYHRDSLDRLVTIAAETLADHSGISPESPEVQVAGFALVALWRIQVQSFQRYADGAHTPEQVAKLVRAEVRRAARLTDAGLQHFWDLLPESAPRP